MHGVYGNVDEPVLSRELPERATLHAGGVEIGLLHDAGTSKGRLARMRRAFPSADLVVFGHSHTPLIEVDDGFTIFNPGSPTQRRRAPARTMGLIEAFEGDIRAAHIELAPAVSTQPGA